MKMMRMTLKLTKNANKIMVVRMGSMNIMRRSKNSPFELLRTLVE